jgi:ABC-type multidrug transport system permease subunit
LIFKLLTKDALRRIKQPAGYLIIVSLPFVFALLLGLAFGPRKSDDSIIQVKMLTEDRDDSFVSHFLTNAFGNSEMQNMFDITSVDSGKGRIMMDEGDASALLIIPAGFGDSLLHKRAVALELVKNPSEAFAPKIAEETVQILAEGGDRLFRIAEKPLSTIRKRIDSETKISDGEMAILSVQVLQLIRKVEDVLFPPLIQMEASTSDETGQEQDSSNFFGYILGSVLVMTLLFMLEVLNRDVFIEVENHTFTRQRLAVSVFQYNLSKVIFVYSSGILSYLLVWIIGVPLFGIHLTAMQGVRLFGFAFILLIGLTGIITFIYALAKTREQAQSIAPAIILGFSMLGGAMIPLESLPGFVRQAAVISPVYWGIHALHEIVLGNASLYQIKQPVFILLLIGVGLIVPSMIIQQRKIRS